VSTAPAASGLSGLDHLRAMAAGEVPPPSMAVTMGIAPVEIEYGRVVFEGTPGEQHYNPLGTVHGGWAATLLDSALGCAVQSTLEAGSGYATASLEVKYLRPISQRTGLVRAEANVVHAGRRQATAEARVTDSAGRVLATATTTCIVLRAEE
jgi:uncharacterized protein (TIGR00369 family)